MLPGDLTHSRVGVIDGLGLVHVIDLDTGDRCTTRPSVNGAWMPWTFRTPGRIVVHGDEGMLAIDSQCAMTPVDFNGIDNSYAAAWTDETVWLSVGNTEQVLTEVWLDTGTPTGREVALPPYNGAQAVAIGDDIVLGVAGTMTLVDPDTDERTDLGNGNPLAVHGDLLAFATCPQARCRLGLLDLGTGERHLIDDVQPIAWDQAVFSADGRFLRVAVPGEHEEQPASAIVDLVTGVVRVIDTGVYNLQFTPNGQWLLGIENGRAVAVKVDGTVPNVEIDQSQIQNLALL